jgi:hypothetical protein
MAEGASGLIIACCLIVCPREAFSTEFTGNYMSETLAVCGAASAVFSLLDAIVFAAPETIPLNGLFALFDGTV